MIVYATILVIGKVAQCDGSFVSIMTARVDRLHLFIFYFAYLSIVNVNQCKGHYMYHQHVILWIFTQNIISNAMFQNFINASKLFDFFT